MTLDLNYRRCMPLCWDVMITNHVIMWRGKKWVRFRRIVITDDVRGCGCTVCSDADVTFIDVSLAPVAK